jgi:hypothetical protein
VVAAAAAACPAAAADACLLLWPLPCQCCLLLLPMMTMMAILVGQGASGLEERARYGADLTRRESLWVLLELSCACVEAQGWWHQHLN